MEKKYVQKNDPVNHPAHYTKGKVECIDAIEAAVSDLNGMEAFLTGQVIKYSYRWKDKGGAEDLRKARWYLNRLINFVENQGEEHEEEPAEITVNPCPNCGCSDTGILYFSDDSTECSVMCERCNFIGPMGKNMSEAVKLWNERKGTKMPGPEIMMGEREFIPACPPPHPSDQKGKENGNP